MIPDDPQSAASYACARGVCRRSDSSFHLSFRLLPPPQRRSMEVLYAFARLTDDLGDSGPEAARRKNLARWRNQTESTLVNPNAERQLPADSIFPALRDVVQRNGIPPRYLLEIVDGVVQDQDEVHIETMQQLSDYCYLVAGTVGLCCTFIWGREHIDSASEVERLDRAAIRCGYAFQLTNILRDIREDAAVGRTYLPRQMCIEHGLCTTTLPASFLMPLANQHSADFGRMIRQLADEALAAYEEGWYVHDAIHPRGRRMFSLIWRTYRELLIKIREHPEATITVRTTLSQLQRVKLAATHFIPLLYQHLTPPAHPLAKV